MSTPPPPPRPTPSPTRPAASPGPQSAGFLIPGVVLLAACVALGVYAGNNTKVDESFNWMAAAPLIGAGVLVVAVLYAASEIVDALKRR